MRAFKLNPLISRVVPSPSIFAFYSNLHRYKQAPQTGIKPHTDFTNFIMTSHLGLDCPPAPQSWMKVGIALKHHPVGFCYFSQ
jgi:hypothetical protein